MNRKIFFLPLLLAVALLGTSCKKEDVVACGTSNVTETLPGKTVHFTSCSQFAESYFWDFGDGETSIAQNPTHEYEDPGTYIVVHKAESKKEKSDQVEFSLLVGTTPVLKKVVITELSFGAADSAQIGCIVSGTTGYYFSPDVWVSPSDIPYTFTATPYHYFPDYYCEFGFYYFGSDSTTWSGENPFINLGNLDDNMEYEGGFGSSSYHVSYTIRFTAE